MTSELEIETLLPWGPPKRVQTHQGPRILRTSSPTPHFSALWRSDKDALKAAGLSWAKDPKTGAWAVCWWAEIPVEEHEAIRTAVQASRATDADVEIPIPEGLEFAGYQKAGIRYALDCFAKGKGCLIGDAPGLGKTCQAIGVINASPKIHRVLVICPNTLKINWYREMRRFLTRPLDIGIVTPKLFPSTDVAIINYDLCQKYQKRLTFDWDMIVADECHRLKNARTIRSKSILGYRPTRKEMEKGEQPRSGIPSKRKLGLTGTPICNRPSELFPVIHWLAPKDWPSFWPFAQRYCGGKSNGFGYDFSGASHLSELQEKLRASCLVRRLKEEVLLDLPPKRRQIIELPADGLEDLLGEERAIEARWSNKLAEMKARVELAKVSEDQDGYASAVASLQAGAKAAFEEGARVAHEVALKKVPLVTEHVREAIEEGEKIVLFAHHLDVIEYYMAELKEFRPVKITGEIKVEERQRAVDAFQEDPDVMLMVAGIKAAGEGLTLTASSHVVFGELDWVPAVMLQCEDRTHRRGQTESVLVQHMVLQGSIDARKAEVIVQKMDIAERALDRVAPPPEANRKPAPKTVLVHDLDEPVTSAGGVSVSSAELDRATEKMTPDQIEAIHSGLRMVAGMCDGARQLDGAGFNKVDSIIGKSLADCGRLSPKQAFLGKKIITKYSRQLSPDILEAAGVKKKETQ